MGYVAIQFNNTSILINFSVYSNVLNKFNLIILLILMIFWFDWMLQAMLLFWHQVCVDCPENVRLIVTNPQVTKNIAFNYILYVFFFSGIFLFVISDYRGYIVSFIIL